MGIQALPSYLVVMIEVAIVMFSAVVHELAHGYTAYLCGDMTAKRAGRLTLNPLAHLDPLGSVILPIALGLLHAPMFGYAKPVPFDPRELRHPRRDSLLVALAGPASNIIQALIGAALFRAITLFWPHVLFEAPVLLQIITLYVYVNLILCFFNLLPIPPLDGSHVIAYFLHGRTLMRYYQIQQYSLPILLILLFLVPLLLNFDPLSAYFNVTAQNLYSLLLFGRLA